jgi:hypothetical protein
MSCAGVLVPDVVRHRGQLVQTVHSLRGHSDRSSSLIAWCAVFGSARTVRISRRIGRCGLGLSGLDYYPPLEDFQLDG